MSTHQPGFGLRWKPIASSPGFIASVAAFLVVCACATPHQSSKTPPLLETWKPFAFLLGSWEATGGGVPGESAGTSSFEPDVQGHVLVRRNKATTPAGLHEDLMILYEVAPGSFRAIYFDNEGHTLQYAVTASDSPPSVVFLTDDVPGKPRFRLSYVRNPDDTLMTRFEIAPPGAGFRTYLEGTARRSLPKP